MIKKFHRQSGLTLIEALIALLVLSIGLVGLGALMITSLKNVHSASYYSAASALTLDLEERLWQRITLEVSDPDTTALDSDGCLTSDVVKEVAKGLVTDWNKSSLGDGGWTDATRFAPPSLAVREDDFSVSSTPAGTAEKPLDYQEINFSFTWTEARFELDSDKETFGGRIVMVCRPTYL
ncbi:MULTISPECIES: type IV pilus modification protein PilV [unclassified Wenzhouxiangella]|uniref:type IV pilus modification protein PilV n=1 Tax=unclassified Wenzhouxiangella TaxID=2613841 RepID=UPI000E32B3EA|nr:MULTISPECIES: type IV pilus modification protein PilV [unclassified Wenzhouxiangella]RFF27320.1 type IV pilus modification protein PilV [Wenzhouxiangella sp. 15181]RFP68753.1 type IV pilus modification protein PilV [Wenzhouxiangella sp. 15190]